MQCLPYSHLRLGVFRSDARHQRRSRWCRYEFDLRTHDSSLQDGGVGEVLGYAGLPLAGPVVWTLEPSESTATVTACLSPKIHKSLHAEVGEGETRADWMALEMR